MPKLSRVFLIMVDVMVDVRIDVSNNDYSTKQEYVYSMSFRENKKVATPVTYPASSKLLGVNLEIPTNNIISHSTEKSTENSKNLKKFVTNQY